MENTPRELSETQRAELLATLQARFEKHMPRHAGLDWAAVQARLLANPRKLWSLAEMERTGGEPDVIGRDAGGAYLFCDCAAETPAGRRNTCYDRAAQDGRKVARPEHNALEMAAEMGIEMLSEEQYRHLQTLGEFDKATSSWLVTPAPIRKLGGALFGDRRYGAVFTYHNGAASYYAVRGFRGLLVV